MGAIAIAEAFTEIGKMAAIPMLSFADY